MTNQLLGLAELAELYGVTKATASNWSRRHTFPQPFQHLKMGPVWKREDVVAWKAPVDDHRQKVGIACAHCGGNAFSSIDSTPSLPSRVYHLTCGDCGKVSSARLIIDTHDNFCDGLSLTVTKKENP